MRQLNEIRARNDKADLLLESANWRVQGDNNDPRMDPTAGLPWTCVTSEVCKRTARCRHTTFHLSDGGHATGSCVRSLFAKCFHLDANRCSEIYIAHFEEQRGTIRGSVAGWICLVYSF